MPPLSGPEMPEGVNVPYSGEGVHPGPLLRKVASIPFVFFGSGQVYGRMGYVVIPAEDQTPALSGQAVTKFQHGGAKFQLIPQPCAGILGIGKIGADKDEIFVKRLKDPTLIVKCPYPQGLHFQGFDLAVDGRSGITLLFSAGPKGIIQIPILVYGTDQSLRELVLRSLGLLYAENIRGFVPHPLDKTPLLNRPYPVDVP
jgi:hypothetical protein